MSLLHMHRKVFALLHELQVFDAVVIPYVVFMVYSFVMGQISTNVLFHNNRVEHYISILMCMGMHRSISEHITARMIFCVTVAIQAIEAAFLRL